MFVYVKYDDELDTSICTKIKDSFAKCVHCSGPHPASYRESTVYQEILNRKNVNFHNLTNKTSKTTLNTAAPQPIRSFPNLEGSRRSKFATTCANAINSHKSNGDRSDISSSRLQIFQQTAIVKFVDFLTYAPPPANTARISSRYTLLL